jgi:hypothetical protein
MAALVVGGLLLPASAMASGALLVPENPCNRLLQALDQAGGNAPLSREDAESYRSAFDFTACRNALDDLLSRDTQRSHARTEANAAGESIAGESIIAEDGNPDVTDPEPDQPGIPDEDGDAQ